MAIIRNYQTIASLPSSRIASKVYSKCLHSPLNHSQSRKAVPTFLDRDSPFNLSGIPGFPDFQSSSLAEIPEIPEAKV